MDRQSTSQSLAVRLAAVLSRAGVDTMFGLPGGGPNLDVVGGALEEGMRFVLAHGETAAAIMASTYGRLTSQPAPVVVTRGPGAASAANGAAQATLDRFPLVVIADTVPAAHSERVPHQRLDQRAMMEPLTKLSATVSDAVDDDELAVLVGQATSWPSGAVHLDFDPAAEAGALTQRVFDEPPSATVDVAALERARASIAGASKPLVLVGVEAATWGSQLANTLEAFSCPVLTTYEAVGVVPTEGDHHGGLFTNGALERPLLEKADLIVALGLDEVEPIPAEWTIEAPVIRLSTVPQESPYLPTAVDVVAPVDDLLSVLTSASPASASNTWPADAARKSRERQRADLMPPEGSDRFGPLELVEACRDSAPSTVTVTVDAGAHFLAVMPNWPVAEPFRLLISNGLATMGFAIPAAIGAALARPGEPVLALTGDGGASMVLAELETIVRQELPVTVVVFNDAALSLIEIKQRSGHGGSEVVRYSPVDFAAIAAASGMASTVVESADELRSTLSSNWMAPRLIDARIDPADYPHLIAATRG